jgi:hypothetical protein
MLAPAVRRYAVTRKRYFEAWVNAQLDNNLHDLALVKGVNSNINSWLKKCQLELQYWTLASRNVNWTAHRLKCTSLTPTEILCDQSIQGVSSTASNTVLDLFPIKFRSSHGSDSGWGAVGTGLGRMTTNVSDYIVSSCYL